ncbi:MAG TPA: VWA domain-containing protein [Thermomicrobiales bacterium]|nr:VWA domain-containing protein [Thermomicrobiales bacterium]
MTDATPSSLTLAALWERPVVAARGDETGLVIRITATETPSAPQNRAPIDVAFALDRSGSMAGAKLELAKQAIAAASHHLAAGDRAALVIFDNAVEVRHELAPTTAEGRGRLRRALDEVGPGGSTNLSGGWLTACQELATDPPAGDRPRIQRSLLLTDGLANIGITDPGELAHHASQLRRRGIATTTIGVGEDFDELLLSGMAEAGGGAFQYIAHPSELHAFFEREIGDLLDVVAIRPRLRITFPHGMRGHLVNAFPVERAGGTFHVDLRDLASGDDLALVFDITTAPGEERTRLAPTVELVWTDPAANRQVERHLDVEPLTRVPWQEVRHAPHDDDAREAIVMERAARDHREAIRLDRAGRFAEARAHFRQAGVALSAAPQTARVREELHISEDLAARSFAPLDEHTRKQRVFESQRRSRGTRHRER